jgi:hypothetical protein
MRIKRPRRPLGTTELTEGGMVIKAGGPKNSAARISWQLLKRFRRTTGKAAIHLRLRHISRCPCCLGGFTPRHNNTRCSHPRPHHDNALPTTTLYPVHPVAAPGHTLGHPVFFECTAMAACDGAPNAAQAHLTGVTCLSPGATLSPRIVARPYWLIRDPGIRFG